MPAKWDRTGMERMQLAFVERTRQAVLANVIAQAKTGIASPEDKLPRQAAENRAGLRHRAFY
eukprot:1142222-Pelagomonas_calceolata.AAC.5